MRKSILAAAAALTLASTASVAAPGPADGVVIRQAVGERTLATPARCWFRKWCGPTKCHRRLWCR